VGANVYDELIGVDLNNNNAYFIGDLAASWTGQPPIASPTPSSSRPAVKFHSGNRRSRPADAAYSLQRAVVLNKSPGFILTQFGLTKDNVLDKVKATAPDARRHDGHPKPYAPTFFLTTA